MIPVGYTHSLLREVFAAHDGNQSATKRRHLSGLAWSSLYALSTWKHLPRTGG
jgi:hypothetical protein